LPGELGPPVSLSATFSTGKLVIAWPSSAAGYKLEMTPALETPVQWTAVLDAPVSNNGVNQVTLTPSQSRGFYRLRK